MSLVELIPLHRFSHPVPLTHKNGSQDWVRPVNTVYWRIHLPSLQLASAKQVARLQTLPIKILISSMKAGLSPVLLATLFPPATYQLLNEWWKECITLTANMMRFWWPFPPTYVCERWIQYHLYITHQEQSWLNRITWLTQRTQLTSKTLFLWRNVLLTIGLQMNF